MLSNRGALPLLLLTASASVATSSQLRSKQTQRLGPLDGYQADEVLCTLGKESKGSAKVFPWCTNWISCIGDKAQPEASPEAVLKAWAPATCKEICGLWPHVPKQTSTTQKPPTVSKPSNSLTNASETVEESEEPRDEEFVPEMPDGFVPDWIAEDDEESSEDDDHGEEPEGSESNPGQKDAGEEGEFRPEGMDGMMPDWVSYLKDDHEALKSEQQPGKPNRKNMTRKTLKVKCLPWVSKEDCSRQKKMLERVGKTAGFHRKRRAESETVHKAAFLQASTQEIDACVQSCENFKQTFSTCVSTILFEPGKLVNMGMGQRRDGGLRKSVPPACTGDTHCMPNLAVKYQKCKHYQTQKLLNPELKVPVEMEFTCPFIEADYEDCKECPQLGEQYLTQYAAFTGGCIDQMHAYRQATAPPDSNFGIPREAGCSLSR